jgi:2-oxoglutarate ferredoxin oxidoreductase subunit beta
VLTPTAPFRKGAKNCRIGDFLALVFLKGMIILMKVVFEKPKSLTDVNTHYCPGCTHGIIHRLIAEAIDELGVEGKTIGIAPVGCAVFAYNYFNCDMIEAAHGRAPAVATGVKRVNPDNIVFTYQGDGDLAAIGTAEIVHAAARGENITVIFVNNAIYGMTNGQMAPTTLIGQITDTTPYGRSAERNGYPIRVSEMLATLEGAAYIERVSTHNVKNVIKAKKAIKKAFETQVKGKGFALVEVLSSCPSNWGLSPVDSLNWIEENMIPHYPLGVFKDASQEGEQA